MWESDDSEKRSTLRSYTRSVSKLSSSGAVEGSASASPFLSSKKASSLPTQPVTTSAGETGQAETRTNDGNPIEVSSSTEMGTLGTRRLASELHQDAAVIEAHYSMIWDPIDFHRSELYDVDYRTFVEEGIVITGSSDYAEATTIGDYLRRGWPSIADDLIEALKDLDQAILSNDRSTTLQASFDATNGTIKVKVKGSQSEIEDTREALAWLGAGLQRTASETERRQCRATVSSTSRIDTSPPTFNISFSTEPLQTKDEGTCWLDFFRSINVVSGYPIRDRPQSMPGLEMSLGLMATLVEAKCVTHFSGHFFIKGYSIMLVLVKRERKTHTWHLLSNGNGDRISYSDDRLNNICPLTIGNENDLDLSSGRHIVGWCSVVQTLAGTRSANYDIHASRLPPPSATIVVDRLSLSAAKYIGFSISGVFSRKQKALPSSAPDVYDDKLTWASHEHVVFFDVGDRRAWFLNGRTALLHLVRASLKHSKDTYSNPLFDQSQLEEARSDVTGGAAANFVLMSSANRKVQVSQLKEDITDEVSIEESSPGTVSSTDGETRIAGNTPTAAKMTTVRKIKITYHRFEDRVEFIYGLLERAVDALGQRKEEDGFSHSSGTELRGYDFLDFVTPTGRKETKATTLEPNGSRLVKFIQKSKAITLFGVGFGDLLKASETGQAVCPYRRTIPLGVDCLAISVEDLKTSLSRVNCLSTDPRTNRENHESQRHNLFEPCSCDSNQDQNHCDKGQVLELDKSSCHPKWSSCHPELLPKQGAVVLGKIGNLSPWIKLPESSGRSSKSRKLNSSTSRSRNTAPITSNRGQLPGTNIQTPLQLNYRPISASTRPAEQVDAQKGLE